MSLLTRRRRRRKKKKKKNLGAIILSFLSKVAYYLPAKIIPCKIFYIR